MTQVADSSTGSKMQSDGNSAVMRGTASYQALHIKYVGLIVQSDFRTLVTAFCRTTRAINGHPKPPRDDRVGLVLA